MDQIEVPGPINFHLMQDARGWENAAMDRPFRLDMFRKFADCLDSQRTENALELGSGPGFLAQFVCERIPDISLTLLDFSDAMHELARNRLKAFKQSIRFVTRNFKEPDWMQGLERFDCIITNQAIHELRHKSFAATLHKQVRGMLADRGAYLVCDHFCGSGAMSNKSLYMTPDEQVSCLEEAGFTAEVLLQKGSLQFVRAS